MALSIALNSALTGLKTNQRALDVAATNVANVNTEGYSRKVVQRVSVVLDGKGSGVDIANITRSVNEFLLKEKRGAIGDVGSSEVIEEFYGRMQDMFGTLDSNSSVGAMIADLAARFQAFSIKPEDLSLQIEIVNKAQLVTQRINDMGETIQKLRHEVDVAIERATDEINFNIQQVQELNIKIAENLTFALEAADLQDQRDVHLNKIAELMNFNSFIRDNGEVVMFTPSGRRLLDRTVQTLTHNAASTFDASLFYDGPGSPLDGIDLGGVDITAEFATGRIPGLVELRDEILPNLYSQLQEMALALHDQINTVHNQGTAFPGNAQMTGTRTITATVPPAWTGTLRVTAVDSAGIVTETRDVNLAGIADLNALVADINGAMLNVTAAINPNGQLVLSGVGANTVAVNEMNSAVVVGSETLGAAQFLGLNDFFTSSNDYDVYMSEQQLSRTAALGFTGNLNFQGTFGAVAVPYVPADSLDTLAANINAALGPQVDAQVMRDGSGYRLRISDLTGGSMLITDPGLPGGLAQGIGLKARDGGTVATIGVRPDILVDPSRIAHAELNPTLIPPLAVGDFGVTSGDNTKALQLADRFNQKISFRAMGLLSQQNSTLTEFAASILALNAAQAGDAQDIHDADQVQLDALEVRAANLAGVNLDEEMADLIQLENAYAASARVLTVTDELLEILSNIGR